MSDEKQNTCGDFGGRRHDGQPCGYKAGWGRGQSVDSGRCRHHFKQDESKSEKKKRLKVIEGNFGEDDDLYIPGYLEETHRKRFRRYVDQLKERGIFDAIDQTLLRFMVLMETFADESADRMIRDSVITEDQAHGGRLRKHPAWKIITQAISRYESIAEEFVIGTATRSKMDILEESTEVDPMEEIINQ